MTLPNINFRRGKWALLVSIGLVGYDHRENAEYTTDFQSTDWLYDSYLMTLQVGMVTLIFQSHQFVSSDESRSLQQKYVENLVLDHLRKMTASSQYWTMFRVGRQATRKVSEQGFRLQFADQVYNSTHYHYYNSVLWLVAIINL